MRGIGIILIHKYIEKNGWQQKEFFRINKQYENGNYSNEIKSYLQNKILDMRFATEYFLERYGRIFLILTFSSIFLTLIFVAINFSLIIGLDLDLEKRHSRPLSIIIILSIFLSIFFTNFFINILDYFFNNISFKELIIKRIFELKEFDIYFASNIDKNPTFYCKVLETYLGISNKKNQKKKLDYIFRIESISKKDDQSSTVYGASIESYIFLSFPKDLFSFPDIINTNDLKLIDDFEDNSFIVIMKNSSGILFGNKGGELFKSLFLPSLYQAENIIKWIGDAEFISNIIGSYSNKQKI